MCVSKLVGLLQRNFILRGHSLGILLGILGTTSLGILLEPDHH